MADDVSKCKVIYRPRGRAQEYSPLALNLYTGCHHGCKYCYVPRCLHKDKTEFHSKIVVRKNVIKNLRHDINILATEHTEGTEKGNKMNEKIKELLCILNLPEYDWASWFYKRGYLLDKKYIAKFNRHIIWNIDLPDLALRLRNEVANGKVTVVGGDLSAWYAGLIEVQNHLGESDGWFMHRSQPIHWIITALIAKELGEKSV